MAPYKRVLAVLKWHSSARWSDGTVIFSGKVADGPANTLGRNVEFAIPAEDQQYIVEQIARWIATPQDNGRIEQPKRDRLAAAYLHKIGRELETGADRISRHTNKGEQQ